MFMNTLTELLRGRQPNEQLRTDSAFFIGEKKIKWRKFFLDLLQSLQIFVI